ncbi:putative Pre-rRNA processing protein associated with U3 snRNP [Kockovaella imperatae]|uniref:Putative Pre-rRNA processing protein associated with U3 snRNP n=1 Tax=Kockovaella imperatae TaxID=4999 RepID=A0A1Y1UEJ7_9TREE|nr:putative Pre-rRNA processing protein associated with U3 snRNP [Kockovaella imperatae]ORX35926.1 putative Pre-rRNA processing protein associated with U3 snRNP [Kockovaella imperatae]
MPDSFFQSEKKRKRPSKASGSRLGPRGAAPPRKAADEDLSSESDAGSDGAGFHGRGDADLSDEELANQNETAREKRLRLAKGYLAKVREELAAEQAEGDYDAAEIDRELIASRLQQDVAEVQGKIHTYLASNLVEARTHFVSTPSHCPTSVAMSSSSVYISTKRGVIFRHPLPSLKREGHPFGHSRGDGGHEGEILCLAASEDGKWLLSGGVDKTVGVWNVEDGEPKCVVGIKGHKDAVTSVVIPPLNNPSYHFMSAALSRHLALGSLSTLSTIDTFFGHQDCITSVSAIKPTVAVTAGSRDRTCRWWKVEEEVQLVFRGGGRTFEGVRGVVPDARKERLGGGWELEDDSVEQRRQAAQRDKKGKGREFVEGSIDCVCMVDDQHFVSGGDSGSISLWHNGKKKPIFTEPLAHGIDESVDSGGPRWITSLAHLRGTDLFASGSWDGSIRLWRLDRNLRHFTRASRDTIPVPGFVNALQILSLPSASVVSGQWAVVDSSFPTEQIAADIKGDKQILLVAAIGQEPRLGRWMRSRDGVKNGLLAVHIRSSGDQSSS